LKFYISFIVILLCSCSSIPPTDQPINRISQNATERQRQLSQLENWNIRGKIAFIQPEERSNASLFWQYQAKPLKQKLNLTTYLGINVLSIESKNNTHSIEIDGETYQGNDLEELIYNLTGLVLPSKALTAWLKGIPYLYHDTIEYNAKTNLPLSLTSQYNGHMWLITYSNYHNVNGYLLAKSFTIKQQDLTIKIRINQWNT